MSLKSLLSGLALFTLGFTGLAVLGFPYFWVTLDSYEDVVNEVAKPRGHMPLTPPTSMKIYRLSCQLEG